MKKLTLDEAKQKIFDTHGYKISLIIYNGSHKYSSFECNICGYKWEAKSQSVWNGNGCKECGIRRRAESQLLSFEYVKEYIESRNCKLLSKEYINCNEPLEIKFECGHIQFMSFICFEDGHRCNSCSYAKRGLAKNKPLEEIMEFLNQCELKFISFPFEHINNKSYICYECKFGHIVNQKLGFLLKCKACKECSIIQKGINRRGINAPNWQGGITEFTSYVKSKIVEWKKDSMKACNYKCVITGKPFSDIHHLYSANLIIKEAIEDMGLGFNKRMCDYPENVLNQLVDHIKELHYKYPLGVCLTENVHTLFHKLYGRITVPEQFYEFQSKIASGEIIIN